MCSAALLPSTFAIFTCRCLCANEWTDALRWTERTNNPSFLNGNIYLWYCTLGHNYCTGIIVGLSFVLLKETMISSSTLPQPPPSSHRLSHITVSWHMMPGFCHLSITVSLQGSAVINSASESSAGTWLWGASQKLSERKHILCSLGELGLIC